MKTKNNKTELLNPEEGEDNLGDALGKRGPLGAASLNSFTTRVVPSDWETS